MSLFDNHLRLGYACILTCKDYTSNRGVQMKTLLALKPIEADTLIKKLVNDNLDDLLKILEWNESKSIKVFRVSSEMFTQIGNVQLRAKFPTLKYFKGDISYFKHKLKKIGQYAIDKKMRLTFHTSPYDQLATHNKNVLANTIFDLKVYYKQALYMGLKTPCLILHVGGVYENKLVTRDRWVERYKKLPLGLQKLIMLENDEYLYGVNDVLYIYQKCGVPLCFDMFHNEVSLETVPLTPALLSKMAKTWAKSSIKIPKMHYSEQRHGERRGAHSDLITKLPDTFIEWAHKNHVDLMLECKFKEQSVFKLLKLYS